MSRQYPLVQGVTLLNATGCMTFDTYIVNQIDLPYLDFCEAILRKHQRDGVLLLEGGGDIHPSIYGEDVTFSHVWRNEISSRDVREKVLYKMARSLNIPILGICRGHQMIAALEGGALYQDIFRDTGISHDSGDVMCEGILKDWFGPRYRVNSLHHQAVRRVPVNAQVIGRATDGIIEALLYEEERMFSAQWHPELMSDYQLLDHIVHDFFQVGA